MLVSTSVFYYFMDIIRDDLLALIAVLTAFAYSIVSGRHIKKACSMRSSSSIIVLPSCRHV